MNNIQIYYNQEYPDWLKVVMSVGLSSKSGDIQYSIKNATNKYVTHESGGIDSEQWYDATNIIYDNNEVEFLIPVEFDDHISKNEQVTIYLRQKGKINIESSVEYYWNPEDEARRKKPSNLNNSARETDTKPSLETITLRVIRGKDKELDLRDELDLDDSYFFTLSNKDSSTEPELLTPDIANQKGKAEIKDGHKFIYHAGKKQQHGEKIFYVRRHKGVNHNGIVNIELSIDWRPWLLVAAILVPLLALLIWLLWPVSLKAVDDESVAIKGGETITFKPLKNDIHESTKSVEMEIIKQPEHLKVEQNGNDLQVSAPEDMLDTFDSLDYKLKQDGKDSEARISFVISPLPLFKLKDDNLAIEPGKDDYNVLVNDDIPAGDKRLELIEKPRWASLRQSGQLRIFNFNSDSTEELEYRVTQGDRKRTAKIYIIPPEPEPFILEDDIAEALPGQRITLLLLENDTLPEGKRRVSHDDPPEGTASVDSDNGELSYWAPPEDIDKIKTIVFPYQVEIDGRSETADIEITIKPLLQLEDDEVTITPGREATVTVLDNDVYPRGEQVYVSIPNKPPGIISASDNPDNSVTVRLAEDAPADYRFDLKYNVTYKNITRTANIIIKTPVEVIRARDDQVTVYPGETRRLRVVDNDDLPGPGNAWALSVSQQPRRGTARTSGDEHIDITLNNVQPGDTDTFTYDLSFENQTDSARVSINVAEPLIARNDILTLTGQTRAGAIDVLNNDDLPRRGRPRVEISSQGQYGEAEPRSRGNIRYKLDQTHDRAIEDSVTYQVTVGDQIKTAKIKVIYKPAPPPQCPRDEQWGEMFLVPAGTYEINDNPRVRQAAKDMGISTRIIIDQSFCIQTTEVSGDKFTTFTRNALTRSEREDLDTGYLHQGRDAVDNIKHPTAVKYINWLERLTSGYRASLPTRREWLAAFSHAAREGFSAGFKSLNSGKREWSAERWKCESDSYSLLGRPTTSNSTIKYKYHLCLPEGLTNKNIGFRVIAKKK